MWSIIQAAGWPIWPLIFASIVALALIFERLWSLRQSVVAPPGMVQQPLDWKALAERAWVYPVASACCGKTAEHLFKKHQLRPRKVISVDREDVRLAAVIEDRALRDREHIMRCEHRVANGGQLGPEAAERASQPRDGVVFGAAHALLSTELGLDLGPARRLRRRGPDPGGCAHRRPGGAHPAQ